MKHRFYPDKNATMKHIKFIAAFTVGFAVFQFIVFGLFFARWFFNIFMWVLVYLNMQKIPGFTSDFLYKLLLFLTYPIRFILPAGWSNQSCFQDVLLMVANSAIWGIGLGTLAFLFSKVCRK